MIEPAVAARLSDVASALDAPQILLVAIAGHGKRPSEASAARLAALAPHAVAAGEALQGARRTLAGLLPDTSTAPKPEALSLSDLAALETVRPDLQELRQLLGKALSVAERIDEARGKSYPDPIGGSCGWDFAEEVNQLLARVELEIGPKGKVD